jgi:6-phosphofructokinase 1
MMKIGVLTGGGDAPGLNAVIYSLVRICMQELNAEMIGFISGYRGLYNNDHMVLNRETTKGIFHKGGTILYSSNKDNLFDYLVDDGTGKLVKKNVSQVAVDNLKKDSVDVLVVLGGDGTLTSARDFSRLGVNVIGIPKTIDNDLPATDATFGFNTAVNTVTESLERIYTTAESHHRVFVVEVMGRNAGWIALESGIAGSADIIIIPEIPYDLNKIAEKIKERDEGGKNFSIIVVAEGARAKNGKAVIGKIVPDSPDPIRYGGIGIQIAHDLESLVKNEIRSVTIGHIQRGGNTSAYDRILSVRYAYAAMKLIKEKNFGRMVCLKGNEMSSVTLEEAIGSQKFVDASGELVCAARALGIYFGD